MNPTIETIQQHASVRKFNQMPISKEEEDLIINSALRGPSAGNMMQYSIIVIRKKETLKLLSDSCDHQPFIASADLALLFVVDNAKWHHLFEGRHIKKSYPEYHGPELPDFLLGLQDAMIAAQNAALAAESLSIGTCYIGDIIEHKEMHAELFNLPQHTMPATLLVMGKYDKHPALKPRFNKSHMVFNETYPDITSDFIDQMFKIKESKDPDFAKKFFSRKIGADFFKEMIRSSKAYLSQWL